MQIVTLKIDDLKPYEKNARKHQALDVAAIAESIKAFGFRDPVGIWGPNNIIVEGHGRMMELDPHYVDVIIDRWQRMTGEEAVLLNDDQRNL